MEKRIPAVTISGVGREVGEVIHTRNDQVPKVNAANVHLGYRLALALVAELDSLACEVSREERKAK
jgi:hypothetical protein